VIKLNEGGLIVNINTKINFKNIYLFKRTRKTPIILSKHCTKNKDKSITAKTFAVFCAIEVNEA